MAGQLSRPWRAALAVAVASTLALSAACGGDDDDFTAPASTTTASTAPLDPAQAAVMRGERLTQLRGCTACHSTDGRTLVGPTWQGLPGSQVKLKGGKTVVADDAYLRRSVTDPDAEVVDGFVAGLMPGGIVGGALKPEELDDVVAYLKTL